MGMRWLDLSKYNISLQVAVIKNINYLVVRNGDKYAKQLMELGFINRENGNWIKEGADLVVKKWKECFPDMDVSLSANKEDILIKQDEIPNNISSVIEENSPLFIGLNKEAQEVYELDGKRFVLDSRRKKTWEYDYKEVINGLFLKAVDENSLLMCSDGFVLQALNFERYDMPQFDLFFDAINVDNKYSKDEFLEQVKHSIIKSICRNNSTTLRDKYGKAIDFMKGLPKEVKDDIPYFIPVLARRMIGTDNELVGKSIFENSSYGLLTSLLPKGVRKTENNFQVSDIIIEYGTTKEIYEKLLTRKGSVRSFIFLTDNNESYLKKITNEFYFESGAKLDTEEYKGTILMLGSKLENEDKNKKKFETINNLGELWTYATSVSKNYTNFINSANMGLTSEHDLEKADPTIVRNFHQTPYQSASKIGTPTTMVPKELEGSTKNSLNNLLDRYNDIDKLVAEEYGYDLDTLSDYFVPEQIDALALKIYSENKGREGFLLGDSTGVGKGRVLVAIAKRAIMKGKKVVLFTEKDVNLSDIMRDIKHIEALDILKPVVLNNTDLIDESTGETFDIFDRDVLNKAIEDNVWPENCNFIIGTFSQANKDISLKDQKDEDVVIDILEDEIVEKTSDMALKRIKWLHNLVNENVECILDEVHNAASMTSNISKNISQIKEKANFTTFSSATFAATPTMVQFYDKLFPDELSSDEIAKMMKKGGEEFQEVVTSMLVADGVAIRREQDLSKIDFVYMVDEERVNRNKLMMDQLADVVSDMAMLSGDLVEFIDNRNRNNGVKSLQMKKIGFGSPLYMLTRLFTAALLADFTAENAIQSLKNGEKPAILVENTLQKILEEYNLEGKSGYPDFKDVVHRILNQMLSLNKNTEGKKRGRPPKNEIVIQNNELDGVLNEKITEIRNKINRLPDLPVSVIDYIRDKIEAEGFSCGEITGRTLEIRNKKVVSRKNRNKTLIKNAFNSGELDALILNVSGSTGIDLHAGNRFKDKRRRVLYELQGPAHVIKQIQTYGRFNRRDQAIASKIVLLSAGLPAEGRLAAMRNQKLRKLSANVSSDRNSAYLAQNIPDIINSVGDIVISRYAEMRPDLMQRLCLTKFIENQNTDENGQIIISREEINDTDRSANEFLSRLMLLPTSQQEKILTELVSEYTAYIQELETKGENPLKTREIEGIVHIRESRVHEQGNRNSNSIFESSLILNDIAIERVAEPVRVEQVLEAVNNGANQQPKIKHAINMIENNRDMYIEPFLPKKINNGKDKTEDKNSTRFNKKITKIMNDIEDLKKVLKVLTPGKEIRFNLYGVERMAIVTSVSAPWAGYEYLPSMYEIELAFPGELYLRRIRLDALLRDPSFAKREVENGVNILNLNIKNGLEGDNYDYILDEFEQAVGKKITTGKILTGNIFKAVRLAADLKLGNLVSFVDETGTRIRGVLLNKDYESKIDGLSLRLDGIEQVYSMLIEPEIKAELFSSQNPTENCIKITPMNDRYIVKLPSPVNNRNSYKSTDAYKTLWTSGDIDSKNNSSIIVNTNSDLKNILEVFNEIGIYTFYANKKHRKNKKINLVSNM